MADFRIAVGETSPAFQRTLTRDDGQAVDVTGATVTFSLTKHGAIYVNDQAATIVTAASGIVKYVWQAGDLTDTGIFTATFKVVSAGPVTEYFEYLIEVIDGAGSSTPSPGPTLIYVISVNGRSGVVTGVLDAANNLSDLVTPATARTNLGLGGAAILNVGTTAGTVAAGNDSRFTDARTPTAHAASHASAGSDPLTLAESQVTNLTTDLAAKAPLASPSFTGTVTCGSNVVVSGTSIAVGTNPASTGILRIPNNTTISARNAANTADVRLLRTDASDNTFIGTADIASTTTIVCRPTAYILNVGGQVCEFGTTYVAFGATASAASAGVIRLPNNVSINWRNAAGSGNVLGVLVNASDQIELQSDTLITNGKNLAFGTTTGTKIGTATTQKISFWNKTPIVQPTTGITGAAFVAGSGTAVNDASTFGGYTLKQIAAALINVGILA